MSLEATMIIVDNSESSRNGDYLPTRFEAQVDAINLIHSAKTQANPESSVGLMSMGGNGPEVLVTLTADIGKILDGLHRTKTQGNSHLGSSIQVAHLALKHRKEKAQRQRIIVFTCSPIAEDEKTLVKLAKKMKKHNVNIDFIAFGDLDSETTKKLEAFHENVNSGDGSHIAVIPPGPNLLSDSLLTTPILGGEAGAGGGGGRAEEGGAAGGGDGGANGFEFGIDPAADPELAFALRMSLEEEKARLEKEKQEKEKAEGKDGEGLGQIAEESQEASSSKDQQGSSEGDKGKDKDKDNDGDKMDTS